MNTEHLICYADCAFKTTNGQCWVYCKGEVVDCHQPFPDYYRLEGQRFLRERWEKFKPITGERVSGVGKGSTQRFYISDRAMAALKKVSDAIEYSIKHRGDVSVAKYKHGSTLSNPRMFVVTLYINGELRSIELKAFDAINAIRILCRVYKVATSAVISVFKSKQF